MDVRPFPIWLNPFRLREHRPRPVIQPIHRLPKVLMVRQVYQRRVFVVRHAPRKFEVAEIWVVSEPRPERFGEAYFRHLPYFLDGDARRAREPSRPPATHVTTARDGRNVINPR